MKPKQKIYDSRCYDLAEVFLKGIVADDRILLFQQCDELATLIQSTIENWIEAKTPYSNE